MSRNRYLLLVGVLLVLLHCSRAQNNSDSNQPGSPAAVTSLIPADAYFTPENPGKWKDRVAEHEILVREGRVYSQGKKQLRELLVRVPLEGDDRHYLEAAVAMDHSLKREFDKVSFAPRTAKYEFKLTVPADSPNAIYVVIKCNQHDMWLARVEPLPKPE
jgi:hypothetical protein